MPQRVSFTLNGAVTEVDCGSDTPLLYVLRNDLELKGTRFGCGSGQCGACFVLIDGHATPACDTPLWSVAGKSVTTVEGLARTATLHPLQQAFLDEQAAQCGYCTSGILMSAAALAAAQSQAHRDRHARCAGPQSVPLRLPQSRRARSAARTAGETAR